jgi:hypothetical protein
MPPVYRIIFDVTTEPYDIGNIILSGIFFVLGVGVIVGYQLAGQFYEVIFRFVGISFIPGEIGLFYRLLGWGLVIFTLMGVLIGDYREYDQKTNAIRALETRQHKVVEGVAVNVHSRGRSAGEFTVNGVRFSYTNQSLGLNDALSRAAPIRDGMQLRISYTPAEILKLEVAQQNSR